MSALQDDDTIVTSDARGPGGYKLGDHVRNGARNVNINIDIAEKRKPVVPNSLSDIPGGTLTPQTRDQAMKEMEPLELMDAMNGMTPEQISDWLNRNI